MLLGEYIVDCTLLFQDTIVQLVSIYIYTVILGYYCPIGQSIQNPPSYTCSAGHYCVQGSINETDCPSGTYQDQTGQGSCKECVAGK